MSGIKFFKLFVYGWNGKCKRFQGPNINLKQLHVNLFQAEWVRLDSRGEMRDTLFLEVGRKGVLLLESPQVHLNNKKIPTVPQRKHRVSITDKVVCTVQGSNPPRPEVPKLL